MNKIIPKNIIQHIGTFVYLLCKTTIRGRQDTLINHPASPYAAANAAYVYSCVLASLRGLNMQSAILQVNLRIALMQFMPRIVSFSHVRYYHSRQSRMYSKLRSGLKAGFVKHMVDVGTYRGKADA